MTMRAWLSMLLILSSSPAWAQGVLSPTAAPQVSLPSSQVAIPAAGQGATGAAVPSGATYLGANSGGNLTGLLACNKTALINTASSGTATIIAISGSTVIYICGWQVMTSSASATNVNLSSGTASNCGSNTTVLTPLVRFPAGVTGLQGMVQHSNYWAGILTVAAYGVCIVNSAAVQIDGIVYYSQF